MERPHLSSGIAKGKWDSNNFSFEKDHSWGTSRPGKQYYACTFCNRSFRSAQALGGHMNVHRRDRARLRMIPLAVSECHNPYLDSKPNTNFSSSTSSSPAKFLPDTHQSLPSLSSPSSASTDTEKKAATNLPQLHPLRSPDRDITGKKRIRGVLGFGESESTEQKDELKVLKKEDTISLDLEAGLLKGPKEDLDLELRLGCF